MEEAEAPVTEVVEVEEEEADVTVDDISPQLQPFCFVCFNIIAFWKMVHFPKSCERSRPQPLFLGYWEKPT